VPSVIQCCKAGVIYVTGFAARALTRCGTGSNGSGCGWAIFKLDLVSFIQKQTLMLKLTVN
jgi:hypothetical protein